MNAEEARRLLGVAPGDRADAVRAAYRRLVLRTHPDLNAAPDAAERTIRLTEAYVTLLGHAEGSRTERSRRPAAEGSKRPSPSGRNAGGDAPRSPGDDPAPPGSAAEEITCLLVDDDTIAVTAPADETLLVLLEVAHRLGEISYLDPSAGMVEVIVEFVEAPTSSVLFTLQGRATGVTDVFCAVEPLSGGEAPPTAAVTSLVLSTLRDLLARPGEDHRRHGTKTP